MIATLRGKVSEKLLDHVVLDVHGVGYGLQVASDDYGMLVVGDESKLYVYEHIREQAHDLYGFRELDSKRLFEQLLEVNGVGPKMALSVMNLANAVQVRGAIAGGDLKFIQQANGVGKRVAERIVVELKDKVGGVSLQPGDALLQASSRLMQDEAIEALVALGYTPQDAARALEGVDPSLSTEERIKQALKSK